MANKVCLFSVRGCSVLSDYWTLHVWQVTDLGNQSKKREKKNYHPNNISGGAKAAPEYYVQKWKWGLEFIREPDPLGQPFRYNVRCVWTSCSSPVPLVFISRKQRVKFTGSSYSTFCNKICTCRVFYRHKANLVCIKWRTSRACNDSCEILSNRNSIFTQIDLFTDTAAILRGGEHISFVFASAFRDIFS